jgi:hypothetical protein
VVSPNNFAYFTQPATINAVGGTFTPVSVYIFASNPDATVKFSASNGNFIDITFTGAQPLLVVFPTNFAGTTSLVFDGVGNTIYIDNFVSTIP